MPPSLLRCNRRILVSKKLYGSVSLPMCTVRLPQPYLAHGGIRGTSERSLIGFTTGSLIEIRDM